MKLAGRKLKCSGKNVSQCCFVHHISHTDCSGVEPGLHGEKPVTNHVCCIIRFVTQRHKCNVLCIYVSDFKEPYPARTAYQVAKLPLVRDVLSFGYGSEV